MLTGRHVFAYIFLSALLWFVWFIIICYGETKGCGLRFSLLTWEAGWGTRRCDCVLEYTFVWFILIWCGEMKGGGLRFSLLTWEDGRHDGAFVFLSLCL